jgi:hypothetical protein
MIVSFCRFDVADRSGECTRLTEFTGRRIAKSPNGRAGRATPDFTRALRPDIGADSQAWSTVRFDHPSTQEMSGATAAPLKSAHLPAGKRSCRKGERRREAKLQREPPWPSLCIFGFNHPRMRSLSILIYGGKRAPGLMGFCDKRHFNITPR